MKNLTVKDMKDLLASMPDDALIAIHDVNYDRGFSPIDSAFLSKAKLHSGLLYDEDHHSGELVSILVVE